MLLSIKRFSILLGEVKSLVFSGKAPVDSFCTIKDNTHVFTEGDDIWDVMLNQVILKAITSWLCLNMP